MSSTIQYPSNPQQALAPAPGTAIADSWQRCRNMGLESAHNPQPNRVSRHDMRHLLERDVELASVAAEELHTLALAVADTDHVVMLVDDQGAIVSAAGEAGPRGPVLRHARGGVDCSEMRFGTNAAGTALVERRVVTVRRGEHFFRGLQHMDCLAAPIFRPGGDLIGALDVSCETRPLLPGVPELVQSSVARIERLLLRELCSPYILRVHPHPGCIGTPLEGLIALGEEGQIVGLNGFGAQLLGVERRQALGRSLGEWFGADLRQLSRRADGGISLRTHGGLAVYATLAEAPDLAARHQRTAPVVTLGPLPALLLHEPAPVEKLTRRELKILRQLESGLANREIAAALFISEGTLKWHLHNIYGKLDTRNRTAALARARRLGLLDDAADNAVATESI